MVFTATFSVLSLFFFSSFHLSLAAADSPTFRPKSLYLVPVDSPQDPTSAIRLSRSASICPTTVLGTSSFFLLCTPHKNYLSSFAKFFLDNKRIRTDRLSPFTVPGFRKGSPRPWTNPPGYIGKLICKMEGNKRVAVRNVTLDCPPGVSEFDASPTPLPSTSSTPSSSPSPSPSPPPALTPRQLEAGCITQYATYAKHDTFWTRTDDGLGFRINANGKAVWEANRTEPLQFFFTPLQTSQHAIAFDMTTGDGHDHNDIWLRVRHLSSVPPSLVDFQLIRKNVTLDTAKANPRADRYRKGYHNANGRKALLYSVNGAPHSMSTAPALVAGEDYVLEVVGRSSKVILHRVTLFPCEGLGCQRKQWGSRQRRCMPGFF